MNAAEMDALLRAATLAPSGDNLQPWRFAADPATGVVQIVLDATRDPSPMNAGQRMSRIALGAALENLTRTAEACGWTVASEPDARDEAVLVRLSGQGTTTSPIAELLAARVTNRRVYQGGAVAPEVLDRLARETPPRDGVSTHWITERERIAALGALIGQADAAMFGEPSMRRAFLENVRFDEPVDAQVREGLSLASLELSPADRTALRLMRRTPDWLIKAGGAGKVFAAKARRLAESASGLCFIAAADSSARTDFAVGRAMQGAWLALTAAGLAVQPMMSLPVLENAIQYGDAALVNALGRDRVAALAADFRTRLPEVANGRIAAVVRFGFAPPPSGRTGRLPLESVMAEPAGSSPRASHA